MGSRWQDWPPHVLAALRQGVVIPAHPLALDADAQARRAAASARSPAITSMPARAGSLSAFTPRSSPSATSGSTGRCSNSRCERAREWTRQAPDHDRRARRPHRAGDRRKRTIARDLGYHAGLLSLAAMKGAGEDELIAHAQAVAREIPLVGFYLQPAVGGIVLPVSFWRRFAAIENVVAIKIAPFNRYRTLDVVRGVVEAGAADRVTLYTGNDDHIVLDLLHAVHSADWRTSQLTVRIKGGLLGHWSVWVKQGGRTARPRPRRRAADSVPPICSRSTRRSPTATRRSSTCANDFHGVIAGCHEILRRQGLLEGIWCLDPNETLGPARRRRSTASARPIRISTTMPSCAPTCERWLA